MTDELSQISNYELDGVRFIDLRSDIRNRWELNALNKDPARVRMTPPIARGLDDSTNFEAMIAKAPLLARLNASIRPVARARNQTLPRLMNMTTANTG
jgi:hypothetical protein